MPFPNVYEIERGKFLRKFSKKIDGLPFSKSSHSRGMCYRMLQSKGGQYGQETQDGDFSRVLQQIK